MNTLSACNRTYQLGKLKETKDWDIVIIGGGATGLGIGVDAASRGYKTILLEQVDFAKGTSSRSTKLVHGGVRYLAQGNIKLVYTALRERGILLKNAPHLVRKQNFIIPCYNYFSKLKYLVGLKLYALLAGRLSFGRSRFLDRKTATDQVPYLKQNGLLGGVEYFDGQFDDARLAVNLAQTCIEQGGVVLNHFSVTQLLKEGSKLIGVRARDSETGIEYAIHSKVIINATGVFVDDILQLDKEGIKRTIRPSQGVHIVLAKDFLPTDSALMIPKTADGRVLFAIPWHDHVLVGTTDTLINEHSLEPKPLEKEIAFILETLNQYFTRHAETKDILSVFAGLRPLAAPNHKTNATKEISRDHKLMVSDSGLITITGGKWTTYRKMAEETIDKAIQTGKLQTAACLTSTIKIHGYTDQMIPSPLAVYGSDANGILNLIKENPASGKKLHPGFAHTEAEVIWSIRNEMARTVEDVLARRLRILFLDTRAALAIAPRVAEILSEELKLDEKLKQKQLNDFVELAKQYLP